MIWKAKQAMGWLDGLKALVNSVDTEYDRRIRTASNVKEYHVGGHGMHVDHAPSTTHGDEGERLQGEGGALGDLQANAGPQFEGTGAE